MPRTAQSWDPACRAAAAAGKSQSRGPGRVPDHSRRLSDLRSSVPAVTEGPTAISFEPPADLPRTLGELRAAGHEFRTVKEELRDNLLDRLRTGAPRFPGIVGFDDTVLPEVERALLAGHDMVLLGERGQGKTRLIRGLIGLLDEWTPYIAGSELHEHPYHPITPAARRLAAETGDLLPIS